MPRKSSVGYHPDKSPGFSGDRVEIRPEDQLIAPFRAVVRSPFERLKAECVVEVKRVYVDGGSLFVELTKVPGPMSPSGWFAYRFLRIIE
jgi:hypothetical protein